MAAVRRHWREASTLILATAQQKDIKPNFVNSSALPIDSLQGASFEVLLLKRSAASKFMPNVYVFPGGVATDIDFSADWIPVFDLLGKDHRQNLFDFVQRGGQGAPIFSRLRDKKFSSIPSEIAFRLCAIRETFEECGVLIAGRPQKGGGFPSSLWSGGTLASTFQDEDVKHWRDKVNEDPREFLHMCQELGVVPDVWSLYEWSNWLTPLGSEWRFDTTFFICCVESKPHVAEDKQETVHSQWGSPRNILHEYYQARVKLGPPQVYEVGRLMEFSSASDIWKFAWHRGQHRVEQWLPVKVALTDCFLSVLPGDSLYPTDVDPEGPPVTITYDKTLAEVDKRFPNKNRMLLAPDNPQKINVICNIALPGEHVAPKYLNSKLYEESSLLPKL